MWGKHTYARIFYHMLWQAGRDEVTWSQPRPCGRRNDMNSSHPARHKVSVATTLLQSQEHMLHWHGTKERRGPRNGGLQKKWIPKKLHTSRHPPRRATDDTETPISIDSPPKRIPVPYVQRISEMLTRVFKKKKRLPSRTCFHVRLLFTKSRATSALFRILVR